MNADCCGIYFAYSVLCKLENEVNLYALVTYFSKISERLITATMHLPRLIAGFLCLKNGVYTCFHKTSIRLGLLIPRRKKPPPRRRSEGQMPGRENPERENALWMPNHY